MILPCFGQGVLSFTAAADLLSGRCSYVIIPKHTKEFIIPKHTKEFIREKGE